MSEENKQKDDKEVLRQQLDEGIEEFGRSNTGLFLSAFTAGLEIGFSILLMGVLHTVLSPYYEKDVLDLIVALGYPLGFIFVIIGRSQLFTEQTALAMMPLLNGDISIKQLLRLWFLVYVGNIVGGSIFALLITWIGPRRDIINEEAFTEMAHALVHPDWYIVLGSATLAGWMMGLLGWLITTSQETVSRILIVILITAIIGSAKLHHCIVGNVELACAYILGGIEMGDYSMIMLWTVIGNIVGGAIFVGALKFSVVKF